MTPDIADNVWRLAVLMLLFYNVLHLVPDVVRTPSDRIAEGTVWGWVGLGLLALAYRWQL